jgi:hypothetical protein
MAFSTGVWNLRALNSGRPRSPRAAMRHKVRRIRSPPKCAAETPPAQTRKSPIPVPPIPDLAGNRGRESPIPDSAEIGNREIPRFPIWPGNGNRGPDSPQIGKSGIPSVWVHHARSWAGIAGCCLKSFNSSCRISRPPCRTTRLRRSSACAILVVERPLQF